jgi:hypothetical protein
MRSAALDYARFAAGHRFLYADGEQLFVKDPATESGRASYVTDFSSGTDATSDPNRSRIVWQFEFRVDPLSLQSGGRTAGQGTFSTDAWVSGGDTVFSMTGGNTGQQLALTLGNVWVSAGNTLQQFTTATGDSNTFGCSPIHQLIGRPIIPVSGTVATTGITLTGIAVVHVDANVALASGTASANAQPPLGSDSSSLTRSLRALHLRRNLLTGTQTEALERQLQALLSDEDEVESPDISEPSLHGLIDFLSEHRALAHPRLSITRNGYFAASWSPRRRAKLTIIFNPGGTADWIAIDLDATHPVHDKGSLPNLPDDFAMWMRT